MDQLEFCYIQRKMTKSLETKGSGNKESTNKITSFANNKAHYVYDKYGIINKNSIFSHFVFW
jgi:hypothetical protein